MFTTSSYTRIVKINMFQTPPIPRYYVDRPEYSQDLKTHLLTNSSDTKATVVTAILGLGAVGKSTLAAALAYDDEVQSRFCDGILWVTLGQEPNLLSILSDWVQALGDCNFKPISVEATINHLHTLLYDKAVLLVVDDAWNTDHAQIFNLGGPRCHLVVTTREKAITKVLGAKTYNLKMMTLPQSMQLLSQKLGYKITGEEAKDAEILVKELGYLPLSLELAAAQVRDGMSWKVLLENIQGEVLQLKTLNRQKARDVTNRNLQKKFSNSCSALTKTVLLERSNEDSLKHLSLTASLNLSIKQLAKETQNNFIWLGILPDDVNITQGMAAVLWGMNNEQDAKDRLAYLRSQELLLDGVVLADGKLTYRLHDLFHELAHYLLTAPLHPIDRGSLSGLGISLTEAHGIFLEKYSRLTDNNLWHTLPNDGYIHQHLVWHLQKAGKIEEIHRLLAEKSKSGANGWYETYDRLGKTELFINDVTQAWKLAEIDWDQDTLAQVISLQCRYALITTSINSLAANLPVNLLVALVKHDLWTPEQGLAYALRKPNQGEKVDSLVKLVDYLPANLIKPALANALLAARQIQSKKYRAEVLIGLANKLTPELLPKALAEALTAAGQIYHEYERAQVLIALADKLTPELLPKALTAAGQIQHEYKRTQVLIALADKVTPELLSEVLAAARQIQSEHNCAQVFSALTNKFPELLPEALATVREIPYEQYRAPVLRVLANKFPKLLPEALATAQNIQYEQYRAPVLGALADKLTQMPKTQLYPLWQKTLHTLSLRTRRDLLSDITALTPVIFYLGGQEAIKNTAIAIQEVSRWWP